MSIQILEAQTTDYKAIHRMIIEFATFQRTPEKVTITLEQMLENKDTFMALAMKDGDKYIGFATYYFGFSSWSGKHLFLDDLYLQEAYRNQGIGQQIMARLKQKAEVEGCKSMRWLVSKWNEAAIRFYQKLGASITETEMTCQLTLTQ